MENATMKRVLVLPPPDYEKMQVELAKTKRENEKLRKIISFGNISTVETLIEEYVDSSRIKLRKIAREVQLNEYSPETFAAVGSLLEYLNAVSEDLGKFVSGKMKNGKFILVKNFEGEVNDDVE